MLEASNNKKDVKEMLAMLYANQIILGKKTYAQVPSKLKVQVAKILQDNGAENLITE